MNLPIAKPVVLRPSGSSCWTKCSAMPWLLQKNQRYIPQEGENEWTEEGSRAHERAANHLSSVARLRNPKDPVWHYVRAVENARTEKDSLMVEVKSPTFYDPGYLGTVDAALVRIDGTRLDIFDMKYGQGVNVSAERNPQMAIYWRSLYDFLTRNGLMDHMEYSTPVSLTIVQPRHWQSEIFDSWETTVGDVMLFTDIIKLEAEKIYSKKGLEFSPSDEVCQFCPARAVCIARHEWELEHLPEIGGDIAVMNAELVKELFLNAKRIRSWLNQIETYVADSVNDNGPMADFFHWKRGTRQGNTKWSDEAKVKKWVHKNFPEVSDSDMHEKSLLSPSKLALTIEELSDTTKKKLYEDFAEQGLTFRPPPKKVLAPLEPGEVSSDEEILDRFRALTKD